MQKFRWSNKLKSFTFIVLVVKVKLLFRSLSVIFILTLVPLQEYIRATKDYSKANNVPKEITLVMHDHSKRKALSFARLKLEHKGNKHELNLVIVDKEVTPLLGLKSSQGIGLVNIMVPAVDTPVNNVVAAPKIKSAISENVRKDPVLCYFAAVFQGIGCLPGEYSIELNKDVQPIVHPPPRRGPVPRKEAMKTELDKMVAYKAFFSILGLPCSRDFAYYCWKNLPFLSNFIGNPCMF